MLKEDSWERYKLGTYEGVDWEDISISKKIEDSFDRALLIVSLNSIGSVSIADLSLDMRKDSLWNNVFYEGFDDDIKSKYYDSNKSAFYREEIVSAKEDSRNRYVRIQSSLSKSTKGSLYRTQITDNQVFAGNLTDRLKIRFPLIVFGDSLGTYPKANQKKFQLLQNDLSQLIHNQWDPVSTELKVGNLINCWNALKYFYPYRQEVGLDWDLVLDELINVCSQPDNDSAFVLRGLLNKIKDGHGWVSQKKKSRGSIPVDLDFINGKVLVTETYADSLNHLLGAEVLKINSEEIELYLNKMSKLHTAASTKTLYNKLLNSILFDIEADQIPMTFRDIKKNTYGYTFHTKAEIIKNKRLLKPSFNSIQAVSDEIYFLNLSSFSIDELSEQISSLLSSKCVIIDGRNYPNGNARRVLKYFIDKDATINWMYKPKVTHPDNSLNKGFVKSGWMVQQSDTIFSGQSVIYLAGQNTASYGESMAAYFEALEKATIVGSTTAGTNGNFVNIQLPGELMVRFTGMKVLKHDGSQLHGIGIIPDVLVERTPEGIAEGRDEVLEKALELAREQIANDGL